MSEAQLTVKKKERKTNSEKATILVITKRHKKTFEKKTNKSE